MAWIENVGEMKAVDNGTHFWLLPEYLFYRNIDCCTSPWFSSAGEKWRLVAVPSRSGAVREKGGYISLFLWKKLSNLNYKYEVTFTIKGEKNDVSKSGEANSVFGYGTWDFILVNMAQTMSRNGLLKILCTIEQMEDQLDNDLPSKAEKSIGEEQKDVDVEIQKDHDKNDESETKGVDRLLKNLKNLLIDGQNSDVVLKAENREFQVHKGILGARSLVFASMFQVDMKEKTSGVVDIPDCTAESFEVFLLYLYTGSAETMSPDNVLNLYYAADKYRVDDLKEECVQFMKDHMSVENICDVVALALRHSETGLLKDAIHFFRQNVKKIIKTISWQKYLEENSTQANELLIKAFGD